MKYKVIGWTYYGNEKYPEAQPSRAVDLAVIAEIRKNGFRFGGESHLFNKNNCCPVLNDGTKAAYSQRGWGAIMAEAWEIDNSNGYAYMEWYVGKKFHSRKDMHYPKPGVDKRKIVAHSKIDLSVPDDKQEDTYAPGYKEYIQAVKLIEGRKKTSDEPQ